MPWWGWTIVGILLFGAELFAVDAQFYLIFVGAGALVVGLAMVSGADLPVWGQWLLFAFLSILSMLFLRRELYNKIRASSSEPVESVAGDRVVIAKELAPGESCRTEFRGSVWTAMNVGDTPIAAGASVRIDGVDKLTLRVKND